MTPVVGKLVWVHDEMTDGQCVVATLPPIAWQVTRVWRRGGRPVVTLSGFYASGQPNGRTFVVDLATGRATRPHVTHYRGQEVYRRVCFWGHPPDGPVLGLAELRAAVGAA